MGYWDYYRGPGGTIMGDPFPPFPTKNQGVGVGSCSTKTPDTKSETMRLCNLLRV